MQFDILTIFPEIFSSYLPFSILGRAQLKGLLQVKLTNIRDFAKGIHKTTDDRPYGGGDGMIMKLGPIYRALESVEKLSNKNLVILLSPTGEQFKQDMAWELSKWDQLIIICGRYEGIDDRISSLCIDRELSIGDYILTGGELAALVITDAVSRLIPGVLGGSTSNLNDSFEDGLLEYPQYTRPRTFQGKNVPDLLLSGHHAKIQRWRRKESLKKTLARRPDLLEKAKLTPEDKTILNSLKIK